MASGTFGFVQLRLELMEGLVELVQALSDGQFICASLSCLFCCHIVPVGFPDLLLCVPQAAMFSLSCIPLLVMSSLLRMCSSLI